ncbi:hypothetical protein HDA32_006033 [Spinactinospora alkalitolerans]|uniref:Uncharacterized protein n=1 Tax=Spinactinospora alkalitolerans TaxID=687207 RepID=A0A852U7Q6_9ACTN|nr:hypothetical protein [Spinactinospora alkalitolerans]NYE50913.1 hypothetical protein [Spinactinospora alkalitolerans]
MGQMLTVDRLRTKTEFLKIVENLGAWTASGDAPVTAKLRPTKDDPQPLEEEKPQTEPQPEEEGTETPEK